MISAAPVISIFQLKRITEPMHRNIFFKIFYSIVKVQEVRLVEASRWAAIGYEMYQLIASGRRGGRKETGDSIAPLTWTRAGNS
ncbi:MAG: hypothetical protein D3909_08180 [Candidatus Electrothrix sp. ATG1]|nr:hypothetical protein [Candidatus Electrothrix sp. ATG1]